MHGNVPCVISQKIVIGERKKKKNVKNNKENDVHLIQKWIPNLNVGTVPMWDFVEKIVIGERKKNVRNNKEIDVHLIQKWIPNLNFGTVPMQREIL